MSQEFIPNTQETPTISSFSSTFHREPVKIAIIGSRQGINIIIHTLYRLRFAEVTSWSPMQPTNNPGEFMSMLIRQISIS